MRFRRGVRPGPENSAGGVFDQDSQLDAAFHRLFNQRNRAVRVLDRPAGPELAPGHAEGFELVQFALGGLPAGFQRIVVNRRRPVPELHAVRLRRGHHVDQELLPDQRIPAALQHRGHQVAAAAEAGRIDPELQIADMVVQLRDIPAADDPDSGDFQRQRAVVEVVRLEVHHIEAHQRLFIPEKAASAAGLYDFDIAVFHNYHLRGLSSQAAASGSAPVQSPCVSSSGVIAPGRIMRIIGEMTPVELIQRSPEFAAPWSIEPTWPSKNTILPRPL